MVQRDANAAGDELLVAFAGRANVHRQRLARGQALGRQRRAEPLGRRGEVGTRLEAAQTVLQIADDVIETDPPEASGGFVLPSRVGDDDDRAIAAENGPGPRGVLAAESDVEAAGEVRRGE